MGKKSREHTTGLTLDERITKSKRRKAAEKAEVTRLQRQAARRILPLIFPSLAHKEEQKIESKDT